MSTQEHKCKSCKHLNADMFSGVRYCELVYCDIAIPWIDKEPFYELYEKGITPKSCPLNEPKKTNKNMYITILNYNKGTVECMEAPLWNRKPQNEEVEDLLVESGYNLSEISYMLLDEKPEMVDVEAGKPMVYTEEDMRNAFKHNVPEIGIKYYDFDDFMSKYKAYKKRQP